MKSVFMKEGNEIRSFRRIAQRSESDPQQRAGFPALLTVEETAEVLRTTRRAIYAIVERHQLPAVIRIRRRVLFRADDLRHWLGQKRAPSPEE